MKIGDVTLNINPTSENYSRLPKQLGEFDRSLAHVLYPINVDVVYVWQLEFYVLDQSDSIVAMKGSPVIFEDYDGEKYDVYITDFGPVKGYPRSDLGRMYLILEEIYPGSTGTGTGGGGDR